MTEFAGVQMAQPSDEQPIYDLLLMLHAENGLVPMSEPKVRTAIQQATAKQGGIIGVVHGPHHIEALTGLFMEQFWYSESWLLMERWNFVHPDHRRTTHAKRLIEFDKWCSDQIGIPLLTGVITNERTEAKVRLYRRQLPYVGGFFLHMNAKPNGADKHV
jgi:hypothetical protein